MTVNICWLSDTSTGEAISLITDSRLSGGGMRFDECKKIFSLPRGDCLISFAGSTDVAYPLINQAVSNVQSNKQSMSRYQDINELKGSLLNEVSSLVSKIHLPFSDSDDIKDIELILAGYSWKYSRFCAWRIRSGALDRPSHPTHNIKEGAANYYHPDPLLSRFVADRNYFNKNHLIITGTWGEVKAIRSKLATRKREDALTKWGNEPIKVLEEVLQEAHKNHDFETTSAGPMQYMRVFKHATIERDAVLWPDDKDYWRPTISGRFLSPVENFDAPLYDPRECKVIQVPYNKNSLQNNINFYDSIQ